MLSKKRFSTYQLRLFLPIASTLWLFAIALGIFHYHRSVALREEALSHDVDHVTTFLQKTYSNATGAEGKLLRDKYLQFLDSFYVETNLDDIYISIIDNETGTVYRRSGSIELPITDLQLDEYTGKISQGKVKVRDLDGKEVDLDLDKAFYYRSRNTDDGRYTIQTMMPYYTASPTMLFSWTYIYILIASTIIMTVLIYIYTSHISRNIIAMHDFVEKVAKGESPEVAVEFANDELGDISRRIVELYESRERAFAEIENEHQIALRATEERNKVRQQLTNNLNHELKTPIGILKGYIDTIYENPDMDNEIRAHFLKNCTQQINRLVDMVTDLSTMARLEGGVSNIPTEKLDFYDVVNSIVFDITESGMAGDMKFVNAIPIGTFIRGNFNLLNNMIANLAKNAIAYSGGSEMGVKLLASNKRFYSFAFYDNGKGIPDDLIPRLFERFFRVDSGRSRKKGGTGLGLPIVKTTVLTLGGTISARNSRTGGLEFVFTLPIWTDNND